MTANPILDFATFQTGLFESRPGDLGRQLNPDLIGDDLLRFLFFETPWIITAPIWRKSSLIRLGLFFDESLPSWQDVDLHIRAIAANLSYVRFPEIDHHVRWRFDPLKTSTAQRRSPEHLGEAPRIFAKFEQIVRSRPGMTWSRQRALCSLYFFAAEQWVTLGNFSAAVRAWNCILARSLGSRVLHLTGIAVLFVRLLGFPSPGIGERLSNKWKGWMRMRTNAELVQR
jgi:hypothetical protein